MAGEVCMLSSLVFAFTHQSQLEKHYRKQNADPWTKAAKLFFSLHYAECIEIGSKPLNWRVTSPDEPGSELSPNASISVLRCNVWLLHICTSLAHARRKTGSSQSSGSSSYANDLPCKRAQIGYSRAQFAPPPVPLFNRQSMGLIFHSE